MMLSMGTTFPILCSWCLWTVLSLCYGLEFRYHNSVEVEKYLREVSRSYPAFTHRYSIGKSVEGRHLWVLVLGKFPREHRVGIPEFKYVGNMHGNEVVGRVLLLQLIDYLTKGYRSNPFVTRLLDSTRVHILPSMNPDGFESSSRDCMSGYGRYNRNGVDLNRNFPDFFLGEDEESREFEVLAIMDWMKQERFALSANLHGGAVVASYPYDNSNGGSELQEGASVSPDNDVFVHLAKTYSYSHTQMHRGNACSDSNFPHGITNGYQWYKLPGGMQDYNYVWQQCLEITLELSCCKFPPERELPGFWEANRPALLAYMQQVHLGVKGQVFDGNGNPVQDAVVEVQGRKNLCPFRSGAKGEYYRLLLPGNYTFKVTFPGHETLIETLSVPYGPENFSALKHDFWLQRINAGTPAFPTKPCSTGGLQPQDSHSPVLLATPGLTLLLPLLLLSLLM
ncbi:carboxypeptidase M isoform X1 [Alosa sapidissima]|uniref:carboxypeptidase M isoform X1 n=3 Tax=Alosa sapidissima TaxID=34773 RepID=UPI001C0957BB|nr:carboxypeptidase M isoform X1 [Alosa sapidissima]